LMSPPDGDRAAILFGLQGRICTLARKRPFMPKMG
jgi:hypothetical protein